MVDVTNQIEYTGFNKILIFILFEVVFIVKVQL